MIILTSISGIWSVIIHVIVSFVGLLRKLLSILAHGKVAWVTVFAHRGGLRLCLIYYLLKLLLSLVVVYRRDLHRQSPLARRWPVLSTTTTNQRIEMRARFFRYRRQTLLLHAPIDSLSEVFPGRTELLRANISAQYLRAACRVLLVDCRWIRPIERRSLEKVKWELNLPNCCLVLLHWVAFHFWGFHYLAFIIDFGRFEGRVSLEAGRPGNKCAWILCLRAAGKYWFAYIEGAASSRLLLAQWNRAAFPIGFRPCRFLFFGNRDSVPVPGISWNLSAELLQLLVQ